MSKVLIDTYRCLMQNTSFLANLSEVLSLNRYISLLNAELTKLVIMGIIRLNRYISLLNAEHCNVLTHGSFCLNRYISLLNAEQTKTAWNLLDEGLNRYISLLNAEHTSAGNKWLVWKS